MYFISCVTLLSVVLVQVSRAGTSSFYCNQDAPCSNKAYECGWDDDVCTIHCIGENSCNNLHFECKDSKYCLVNCINSNSCSNSLIDGRHAGHLHITMKTTKNTNTIPSSNNALIICPDSQDNIKNCEFTCQSGVQQDVSSAACFNLSIYAIDGMNDIVFNQNSNTINIKDTNVFCGKGYEWKCQYDWINDFYRHKPYLCLNNSDKMCERRDYSLYILPKKDYLTDLLKLLHLFGEYYFNSFGKVLIHMESSTTFIYFGNLFNIDYSISTIKKQFNITRFTLSKYTTVNTFLIVIISVILSFILIPFNIISKNSNESEINNNERNEHKHENKKNDENEIKNEPCVHPLGPPADNIRMSPMRQELGVPYLDPAAASVPFSLSFSRSISREISIEGQKENENEIANINDDNDINYDEEDDLSAPIAPPAQASQSAQQSEQPEPAAQAEQAKINENDNIQNDDAVKCEEGVANDNDNENNNEVIAGKLFYQPPKTNSSQQKQNQQNDVN